MNLARKHRPSRLADLRGQDALVRVMTAAIEHDRVAQAYILTGIRGTGKTTTARIIARSLNCENGPTVEPCGTCRSCTEIASDSSLDVIELDAASRNGVGDMRDLIETISYAPMIPGASKIYIIDEAHMLSTAAWNALLKTLEEPPAHALFIFATTEARKIPATIQSRCQRFALKRIEVPVIASHLEAIASAEGARLADGVAQIIARAAEGSMRDALSILDQAIAGAAGETIEAEAVLDMIGRVGTRALIEMLGACTSGDPAAALTQWRGIVEAGVDPISALDDLMVLMHQAALVATEPGLVAPDLMSGEDRERLASVVASHPAGYFTGALKMLFEMRTAAASNPNSVQAAEILVMRLAAGFARKG